MEMKEISFGLYSEALCFYPILYANKSLLFANKVIFAGGLHGAIAGSAPLQGMKTGHSLTFLNKGKLFS